MTGALWKFLAWLNTIRLPAAIRDAMFVKNANVIGSTGSVVVVVGAGITVFEALKAYDLLKAEGISIRVIDAYSVQPIDKSRLSSAARAAGGVVITVEDHYSAGGLGDAVAEALADSNFVVQRLAVRDIPRSGQPDELVDRFGISARHVVETVKRSRTPLRLEGGLWVEVRS